jgi:hypothetical protein
MVCTVQTCTFLSRVLEVTGDIEMQQSLRIVALASIIITTASLF